MLTIMVLVSPPRLIVFAQYAMHALDQGRKSGLVVHMRFVEELDRLASTLDALWLAASKCCAVRCRILRALMQASRHALHQNRKSFIGDQY